MRRLVSALRVSIGVSLVAVATGVLVTGPTAEPVTGAGRGDHSLPAPPQTLPAGALAGHVSRGTDIQEVTADVPSWMDIPALGLSVPVRILSAAACPVINPPTLQDAYWVECRAMPGTNSEGTVFITGHTVAGGEAVFNDLPKLGIGDDIEIKTGAGDLVYRVNKSSHYGKYGDVQKAPEVRERVSGRLVLVTCYVTPDGEPSTDNLVVQAQLLEASPHR